MIEPQVLATETVTVEVRGGRELDVDVRALPLEQFKHCKKISTNSYDSVTGGPSVAQIEEVTFSQNLCAFGITDPPLNNVNLRNKHGVHSNQDLVAALFPPKTILRLGGVITRLTLGNDTDDKDKKVEISVGTDPKKVEEAKN